MSEFTSMLLAECPNHEPISRRSIAVEGEEKRYSATDGKIIKLIQNPDAWVREIRIRPGGEEYPVFIRPEPTIYKRLDEGRRSGTRRSRGVAKDRYAD